jgi:transcriptional regulator with GAF, ATPase, and Fis domain
MATPTPGLDAGREALRRFLVGDDDLTVMLTKITMISTETVPGCDLASITMFNYGGPYTPVYTDKKALGLDKCQYTLGDGPCLAAIRHQGVEHLRTDSDERWPTFNAAARDAEVLSVLSAPLVRSGNAVGGLNMYSESIHEYDAVARQTASLFADQIGLAAANASMYAESYEVSQQLREAMEYRAEIEQAKGILMAAQRCGPDEAFDILRRASQNQNRKLRAIAIEIVSRYTRGDAPAAYESPEN